MPILSETNKNIFEDKYFDKSINIDDVYLEHQKNPYKNAVYKRVNCKKKIRIRGISFEHSFFNSCTMRNVVFEECSFVNCRFINCDFKDSYFNNCDFRYSQFNNTFVDIDIIKTSPREHNLKAKFLRSLRVNFQQLGMKKKEEIIIKEEIKSQKEFLKSSWSSQDDYYKEKYRGIKRLYKFIEWTTFVVNDIIWGAGESIKKCITSTIFFLILIALITKEEVGFLDNFIDISYYFIGSIDKSIIIDNLSPEIKSLIICVRYIVFGAILSIIIKRFSTR